MISKFVSVAILSAAAVAAVGPARAAPGPSDYLMFVPYGDLNLASEEGSKTLERRMKAAAHQVCGSAQAPGLVEIEAVGDCRDRVFAAARPKMELALAGGQKGGSIVMAASK
jgi:UrcA family protein